MKGARRLCEGNTFRGVIAMKIVRAQEAHVPEITELWKELMDYHRQLDGFYSRREDAEDNFHMYLRDCMDASDCLAIVAVENGRALGYSVSSISSHPPVLEIEEYGLIRDMAVGSEYRGRGIGSALLMETLDWFSEKGIERIELHVAAGNPIGNSFWSKHGFKDYEHILYLNRGARRKRLSR
jgi:GNAT superfamily N-acetyltransferase